MGRKNGIGVDLILTFLVIGGNMLLFSGSLFGDLADNPLAWIIAILAVGFDIYFIISLFPSDLKRSAQSDNEQETNTRSEPNPAVQRGGEQVEPDVRSDTSKFGLLKAKYSVPEIPMIQSTVDPLQKEMESYQCLEVIQTVNRVIGQRKDLIRDLVLKKHELDKLISCPGCSTEREKRKYLIAHEEELSQKKKEYLEIIGLIGSKRVILLSKERQIFLEFESVFSEISSSQKVNGVTGVEYKNFVRVHSEIPGDLFETEQSPIELNFGAYRLFLLPDVVLAYNRSGEFITAFDPKALTICIQERTRSVYVSRTWLEDWTYSDDVVASDSILISQGYVKSRWRFEKKNGGPDLRYSYENNPRYDSRTDTYGYTEASIQIGNYKAVYSASKGAIAARAKQITEKYCSISHKLNATPSLLRLLESTAKKKDSATDLCSEYSRVRSDIVCKEA